MVGRVERGRRVGDRREFTGLGGRGGGGGGHCWWEGGWRGWWCWGGKQLGGWVFDCTEG